MATVRKVFPSLKRGRKWVKENLHNQNRTIQKDFGGGRWVLYYDEKDLRVLTL